MKKVLSITAILAVTLLSFSSCKKCSICKYSYSYYNSGTWDHANKVEEFCGNNAEVDAFENQFREDAAIAEVKDKGKVICTFN